MEESEVLMRWLCTEGSITSLSLDPFPKLKLTAWSLLAACNNEARPSSSTALNTWTRGGEINTAEDQSRGGWRKEKTRGCLKEMFHWPRFLLCVIVTLDFLLKSVKFITRNYQNTLWEFGLICSHNCRPERNNQKTQFSVYFINLQWNV